MLYWRMPGSDIFDIHSMLCAPHCSRSSPPASRSQEELIVCGISLASPSLRFSRLARPAASTTQRAFTELVGLGLGVVDRVLADLASRSTSPTRQPWSTSTPSPRARAANSFSNRPRSIWKLSCAGQKLTPNSPRWEMSLLSSVGREEAQSELDQMALLEVGLHPDYLREVVRACRHGRFADLERRQRRGALALLEHHHRGVLSLALELDRERQSGQPATQDRDVIALGRRPQRHHLELRRATIAQLYLLGWVSGAGRGPPMPGRSPAPGGPPGGSLVVVRLGGSRPVARLEGSLVVGRLGGSHLVARPGGSRPGVRRFPPVARRLRRRSPAVGRPRMTCIRAVCSSVSPFSSS